MAVDGLEAARAAVEAARAALDAAGVRTEAVAELVPEHRRFGIRRPAALKPISRAWRLGVLLLGSDGSLLATGRTTRASAPGHGGHVAVSIEERRAIRAAAFRGPFEKGSTVDFDARPLPLEEAALRAADGPLFLRDDDVVRVRWTASAADDACPPLESYLRERVDLLVHPLQGATD